MINYFTWNGSPVIFDLGIVSLRWYSLFFGTAFIATYQILRIHFRRDGIPQAMLDKLTVYIILGTVVGARLGHCLFYDFEYYSHHVLEIFLPVIFQPSFKFVGFLGLASHGGAIGILIAVFVFSKRHEIAIYWVLDKLALVIPLAGCLIRIGNFMNSEMIGRPTIVPWAIIFERVDEIPRHPGQLYEGILYLFVFIVLNILNARIRKEPGFIFGLFLTMLFTVRLFVEFWKENQSDFENNMILNMGQILSIPFIVFGIWLVITRLRNTEISKSLTQ